MLPSLELPALAVGVNGLVQRANGAQHDARVGIGQIDAHEVPARIAQANLSKSAMQNSSSPGTRVNF